MLIIFSTAPTSAGKTFISYYAMEKVLRESDDGILAYIAPTKALVTQIAAEIYARFSKNLKGSELFSSLNDFDCHILIILLRELLGHPHARLSHS